MVAEFTTDLVENRLWLYDQEGLALSTPARDRGSRQLGQRAVVIGAGMGGLSAAGALAKYFERAELVDQLYDHLMRSSMRAGVKQSLDR